MTTRLCLALTLLSALLTGCASVPGQVARELAPPDGSAPDHFRPPANVDAEP